jgi:hypothetical protein
MKVQSMQLEGEHAESVVWKGTQLLARRRLDCGSASWLARLAITF